MRTCLVVVVLLGACDDETRDVRDLTVPTDLAADLSVSRDLKATCAGSRIEGTCVERFFQPFMDCFAPAGRCGFYGRGSFCWENGASFERVYPGLQLNWTMNGQKCLSESDIVMGQEQYCTGETSPCEVDATVDDGGLHHYFNVGGGILANGIFTCPDGTQVEVGSDFGGCAALQELLSGVGCNSTMVGCQF